MALRKWKHTVHVKDILKNTELSLEEKGQFIARALTRLTKKDVPWDHEMLDFVDIIEDFRDFKGTDVEEFDDILRAMYDWADNHDVWVA